MKKIAIVTGGSSGIGLAAAAALRDAGCTVYEFSRHSAGTHGINHIDTDVAEPVQVAASVDAVFQKEGQIDVVINCAGYGISGAAEFTPNEDAAKLLEVNLFGVVNMCKSLIPIMRKQESGRIVNVSSVAAPVPIPFQAWYSVSKAAVSTYSSALANEVKPFGISICTVLPGDVNTGFTAARRKSQQGDDIYKGRIARSVGVMEKDERNGMSPQFVGSYIAKIALQEKVKPEYAVGSKYKFLCAVAKFLPCGLKSKIIYLLYAKEVKEKKPVKLNFKPDLKLSSKAK